MKTGDFPTNSSRGPKSRGVGPPLRPRKTPRQQHPPGRSHQPCCREQPSPRPVATANTSERHLRSTAEPRLSGVVLSRYLLCAYVCPTPYCEALCIAEFTMREHGHVPGCSVLVRRRCKSFSWLRGSRKGWNHPVCSSALDSARCSSQSLWKPAPPRTLSPTSAEPHLGHSDSLRAEPAGTSETEKLFTPETPWDLVTGTENAGKIIIIIITIMMMATRAVTAARPSRSHLPSPLLRAPYTARHSNLLR